MLITQAKWHMLCEIFKDSFGDPVETFEKGARSFGDNYGDTTDQSMQQPLNNLLDQLRLDAAAHGKQAKECANLLPGCRFGQSTIMSSGVTQKSTRVMHKPGYPTFWMAERQKGYGPDFFVVLGWEFATDEIRQNK